MATIYDVLEAPGYVYGTSTTVSKNTKSHGLGPSLLMAAQDQQQEPLPPSLVYEPDMVAELYRNAKQSLLLEVGQLEADPGLSASAQMRRENGEQQIHEHNDENSAVQMDWSDFVDPAVRAARQILARRGVDAVLRYYASSAKPAIDTAIEVRSRDRARKRRLVILKHKAHHLASNALGSLQLLVSLAQEGAHLDYTVSKSTSSSEATPMEPISEARLPDESIPQSQPLPLTLNESCRKKAISILTKTACYISRDQVGYGIISCHEQWVFLKITASNQLALSQVYSAPSTEPPLCGTLFALIIQAVGTDPFSPRVEQTSTGADQGAESQSSASRSSRSPNRDRGQGHSSGRWPAVQASNARHLQHLLLTANFGSGPAPPLEYDPQQILRTGALLHRHSPPSTVHSQSLPLTSAALERLATPKSLGQMPRDLNTISNSSTDSLTPASGTTSPATSLTSLKSFDQHHSHAVVPLKSILAMGASATVFRVHHTDLLVKVFGPEEGCASGSDTDFWEDAFLTEAAAYETCLSAPALEDVVPRYYGSFMTRERDLALILLQDVGHPISKDEDFGTLAYSDRLVILGLLHRLAQSGIMTVDLAPRNVLKSAVDQKLRLVDFGQVTAVPTASEQRCWLEGIGMETLMLALEDVRRVICS